MHTYTYLYIYTHLRIYVHRYAYIYISVYIHIPTYIRTSTCIHTHIYLVWEAPGDPQIVDEYKQNPLFSILIGIHLREFN